jgi:integrase
MAPNAFRLAWERVRRRAGLDDLHFHDLRHEALSRFFEMGLTTPEVASISGHRDPRMLFRYSHPMRQRVLNVIDRAQARGLG